MLGVIHVWSGCGCECVGVGVGVGVRLCVSNVVYMGVGGALIDMLTLETR